MRRSALLAVALAASAGCRIETAAPGERAARAEGSTPSGDLWVYTSMYQRVIDAFEPLLREKLPDVRVHWYQAGSEKVAARLEAERAAAAVKADVLATSDPFLYVRLRAEDALLRYASPNVLRVPRSLLDLDAHWTSVRLSTMVLVHRSDVDSPPRSFAELAEPRWRGQVALGDPLTSGTAFTWAVFMERRLGGEYFDRLRENSAIVAGGNAAVLQKVEGGEARVGVLLLENALLAIANGSPIRFAYPEDGAVVIPGPAAIFASSRNPVAARALVDLLLSPEGQRLIVEPGDMHAVDPRLPGPRGERGLESLLSSAQPWSDEVMKDGVERGAAIKKRFAEAFAR